MTDREWLERVISDALTESLRDGRPVVACLADAVERVRLAAPAPTTPPVWPGLEGEGLERAMEAYHTAYTEAIARGLPYDDGHRAGYTANAAYLWRAMVASLPRNGWGWVLVRGKYAVDPDALAALADPYDGGGK
jgi:hypothetical protein